MNKTERIKTILGGRAPDIIPFSFWTHFPDVDQNAVQLAETTYDFYRELDLDFIKNMPNGMFSIQDWGCICDFSEIAKGGVAKVEKVAVEKPEDWLALEDLDVEKGCLGRELDSLRILLKKLDGEAPVLATVFSPLTTAYKLSDGRLLEHLKTHPDKVKAALAVITATTCRFAEKAVAEGCAGLYLATQLTTTDKLTEEAYSEFGVPYDVAILKAVKPKAWFNVIHVHGNNIMFNLVKEYPVEGVSWHIWETPPDVAEFLAQNPDKVIIGGLQRSCITDGLVDDINCNINDMIRLTQGRRLMFAPGCVIRHPCDRPLLKHVGREIRQACKSA